MGSRRSVFYAYIHKSSTQDALALRTRDGGLKSFMTSQLSPNIKCHRLSCIMIYIVFLVTHFGFFRGLGICETVVQLKQLLFKGVAVMSKLGMCIQSTGSTRSTVLGV